jgi:hypothetical protein
VEEALCRPILRQLRKFDAGSGAAALNRLAHRREETRHSSGIALNYGGKLRALGERHTQAVDANVADLVASVVYHEPPINLNWRRCRRMIWLVTITPAGSLLLPFTARVSPPYCANR